MKRIFITLVLLFFVFKAFSQEFKEPAFIIELNAGYAIGIDLPNVIPIEIKLVYPVNRFGLTIESGALLGDNVGFHFFIGPTFFVMNNYRIRVPLSLGFDINVMNKSTYYGIGTIVSFNYFFHKNMFLGLNLSLNYNFNNPYKEVVRIETKDASIGIDPITGNKIYPMDKDGNPIYEIHTPIMENRNHFGKYIHIKPTISMGFQF